MAGDGSPRHPYSGDGDGRLGDQIGDELPPFLADLMAWMGERRSQDLGRSGFSLAKAAGAQFPSSST